MIVFDQISKSYSTGDKVLEDISFNIDPQELVIISGPSGSGKTSILRMIVKDLEPTSGKVFVDGDDLTELPRKYIPALRRKVGFAFQDYKVIPDKTVWENIALSLEIIGLKPADIAKRVQHLLELTGLTNKGELFPRQLSGGELQRVGIARAIAPEPKILLADEPTGNLDAETAWGIVQLLSQINQMGTTVIVTSHNLQIINDLDARHIQLKDGRIAKDTKAKKAVAEEGEKTAETEPESEVEPKKKKKKVKVKKETI